MDRQIYVCEGCESMCKVEVGGSVVLPLLCFYNEEPQDWLHKGQVKTLLDKVQSTIVHSELCSCELCMECK